VGSWDVDGAETDVGYGYGYGYEFSGLAASPVGDCCYNVSKMNILNDVTYRFIGRIDTIW
jgi:hypothetical protein